MTTNTLESLQKQITSLDHLRGEKLQKEVVALLDREVAHYNWTGFYFTNDEKQQLEIGPYVGEHTDHTVIPFGRGICGQVAVSGETFEVPDVKAESNYLSCSLSTKSEIVVPMYLGDKLIGQIDIDSHELDPFTPEDHTLLEFVVNFVAERL